MTHLRKMMLEELQRRHYSEATTQRYIRFIERFAQHFHRSPDRLGPQHIREYQAQLFRVHKLTPGSVTNHLCALRFQGLRPHPPLRLPRQPKPCRPAATVLRRSPRHSTEKRSRNFDRSYALAVALSQMRRTDGRRRTIRRRTTPTPFSTAPGHRCMKSLAHTPHCWRASERLAEVCLRYTQTSSSCPA